MEPTFDAFNFIAIGKLVGFFFIEVFLFVLFVLLLCLEVSNQLREMTVRIDQFRVGS